MNSQDLRSIIQGCWEGNEILILADYFEEHNCYTNLATLIRMIESRKVDLSFRYQVCSELIGVGYAGWHGGRLCEGIVKDSKVTRRRSWRFRLINNERDGCQVIFKKRRCTPVVVDFGRHVILRKRPTRVVEVWDFHDCLFAPIVLFWALFREYGNKLETINENAIELATGFATHLSTVVGRTATGRIIL